jgi:hypothetical protein
MASRNIEVLNPQGTPAPIQLVPLAPRLDTLEGKTIYMVHINWGPMGQALAELQRILTDRYPKTKWILKVKEGGRFQNDPKLWAEIKEKGDGAIISPEQLDTGVPAVIIFSKILEKLGVPTTPIVTAAGIELTRDFAYKAGMPGMRFTFVPYPFANKPIEIQRKYLEGKDPISGKPVIQEIVDALTKPTTEEEKKTGVIERPRPRMLGPDTPENLERLFHENGWTDYLPIVLPTEERVAEMLKGTSHKPDEVIGMMLPAPPNEVWEYRNSQAGMSFSKRGDERERIPVTMEPAAGLYESWEYTVEHVAINAVMAGAKPEYFPVILAIASTGVTSLWCSDTSFARMVVVNGPIRKEINMNSGLAALGPFNQANAVIGRAWTLISKNLGGSILGKSYLGDIGNNLNYNNVCFAENEEALPEGWSPLHVQKGFRSEESVVSAFSGWSMINYGSYKPYPHNETMKWQLISFQTSGNGMGRPTFLLDPLTAIDLKNEGFESKEQLIQWLKENAYMTLWNYWAIKPDDLASAKAGVEPFASLLKLPQGADSPQPLLPHNSPVEILVVGGGTEVVWQVGDFSCMASASVDIWR